MTCSCLSSTLRRSQRLREKSLPRTLTLTNSCTASSAVCTPGTRVCSMLSAWSVWKRDLRKLLQATRKHATTLVAITIQAIPVSARSPVAMSPRETSNRTSHEREKTFSSPRKQDCANKKSRGRWCQGRTEQPRHNTCAPSRRGHHASDSHVNITRLPLATYARASSNPLTHRAGTDEHPGSSARGDRHKKTHQRA